MWASSGAHESRQEAEVMIQEAHGFRRKVYRKIYTSGDEFAAHIIVESEFEFQKLLEVLELWNSKKV